MTLEESLLTQVQRELATCGKTIAAPFLLERYPNGGACDNPCAAALALRNGAIIVKFAAAGRLPKNSAKRDNEPTWATGDVIEFFIQPPGRIDYYEFHITPESRRLQLHFPLGKIIRKIPYYKNICDCNLAVRTLSLAPDLWTGELSIPLSALGITMNAAQNSASPSIIHYCVSRYYYENSIKAELSSHPALTAPRGFHNPPLWQEAPL